jgi:tetratricopeptide (TPR) repeat protein
MRFRNTLTFFMLVMGLIFALPAVAQQKPMTQDQVQALVRDGFGDESGAKLIEQRGIDFAPAEDFMQTLKAAGASEVFLNALRAAKPPEPASAKKPLNQVQVFALLVGEVPSHRVTMLVQECGIDFDPTDDYLQEVRLAGGEEELIGALKIAKVMKPVTVDPAAQARQAAVRQHVARGAEFFQKKQYADAESEYRAAVRLDPQNADVHVAISRALNGQRKSDEALAETREALRLNPNNDAAHNTLGFVLGEKDDWDGEIAEEREALRLNPNNDAAHADLGFALEKKGDRQGALEEYRAAYTLDPKNPNYKEDYETLLQPSPQLGRTTPTDISGEWKSLTAGATYKVRLEEGHAYIERLAADEQRASGAPGCDLKLEDGRYSGVCTIQYPVTWTNRFGQTHKVCTFQRQMVFTKYTPSRVEGRSEVITPIGKWSFKDYKECGERFKPEWKDFIWIRPY